uniref:non-specific serine/threonine protein kinase n=1 Tax=Lactuca sativa TaxID=4236 RepID=A0A9R1XGS5_LACSA|nr:hypothetical protein LSAT_V11C400195460 [Lactuca sativa]
MYGNYDLKNRLPVFDVYLGPDYWDTMRFNSSSQPRTMEIIHVLLSDFMHVCLVNTNRGTPFISSIEVRPLANDMYNETDAGSLYAATRENFGSKSTTVRYKADKYDRLWGPSEPTTPDYISLNTSYNVSAGSSPNLELPFDIMGSAVTPKNLNLSFDIEWDPVNTSDTFFIYMHFAEIEQLKRNQTREFNIYLNGKLWHGPLNPLNHTTTTIPSTEPEAIASRYKLTINKTRNSTLPPIINALELYVLKKLPQKQTEDQDASAIWSIKSVYGVKRHWQGDPCAPRESVWIGLNCSYNDADLPRIIFLNLSTSGLNGEIHPGLASLTMIETLDLSNNNLTGPVPDFLSKLNSLKVLNLKGNNFSGPIPKELLEKSNKGSLLLSIDDEDYCDTKHCENKVKKILVPVIATVASIFVIMTALTTIWMIKKQKAHVTERLHSEKRKTSKGLEIKKQKYTYSEIKSITDNFKVVIGKGGFGEVYHGYIGDVQVAVKMLSASSQQGDKEFQAEAYLLLSVHHRNLTSLVGYCIEGKHKGIIYEYMANGNLQTHLFDTSSKVLNWEERLQIACDAAKGLEYLHHGCKPPIVHRDVKCNNILLNEKFQAKLADFGLCRAFPTEAATHISTEVAGTPGYLDPEYYLSYRLTEKSDLYSFGVVLLVIITGQPAITRYENDNIHISRWVKLQLAEGDVKSVVDPKLLEDFDDDSALKAVELAMACVANTPNRRPTMNDVVMGLNECLVAERARLETKVLDSSTEIVSVDLEDER